MTPKAGLQQAGRGGRGTKYVRGGRAPAARHACCGRGQSQCASCVLCWQCCAVPNAAQQKAPDCGSSALRGAALTAGGACATSSAQPAGCRPRARALPRPAGSPHRRQQAAPRPSRAATWGGGAARSPAAAIRGRKASRRAMRAVPARQAARTLRASGSQGGELALTSSPPKNPPPTSWPISARGVPANARPPVASSQSMIANAYTSEARDAWPATGAWVIGAGGRVSGLVGWAQQGSVAGRGCMHGR